MQTEQSARECTLPQRRLIRYGVQGADGSSAVARRFIRGGDNSKCITANGPVCYPVTKGSVVQLEGRLQ